MNSRARSLAALCGFSLACACASSVRPRPAQPTLTFSAPTNPATHYMSDPPAGDALLGPHGVRAAAGITRAAESLGKHLIADPRLAELASLTAQALGPSGSPPAYAVIDFWARQLGLIEPTPVLLTLQQGDGSQVEENVRASAAKFLARQYFTHFGAATFERDGGVLVVVAISTRWTSLKPVPRSIAISEAVHLEGQLLDGTHDPLLVVSYPDGTSERRAPGHGVKFSLDVPTHGQGEHRVELLANSPLGITVVANIPVYVGVVPPSAITLAAPRAEGELSPEEVNTRMLALINEDRRSAGKLALSAHAGLAEVALQHSVDMDAHAFVGHTSPTTGSAPDRMVKAGIRTPIVLENIGRSYAPEEIHKGLMDSPGHRANVLSAEVTHVGIGTAVQRGDGQSAYLVTEVFARMAEKIDLDDASERLLEAVNRERKRLGRKPLTLNDTLNTLCSRTADAFFDAAPGSPNQPLVEALSREAGQRKLPYTRLAALMTIVTALDEAAALDALLDPKARGVGLGVAQGTRTDTPQNAIAVVALIGY